MSTTNNAVDTTLSGQSGTGAFAGSVSPILTTPTIGQINEPAHTLPVVILTGVASAVDEVTLTNSATGITPSVSATGTDTNISLLLKGKGTGGVAIMGYTDGSSASAGQVGEIISSAVVYTTASLTTATPANITNVPLTAGTWIVWGWVVFAAGGSTTITYLEAGINSVSATLPNILTPIIGTSDTRLTATFSTGGTNVLSLSPAVIPISANTTIYLVGSANFGTSTMTAGGVIIAQRVR